MTTCVSESLKKQCAMTSFSCHILLDQNATIFQNAFFSFTERLIKFVNCSLFYTFIFRFLTRV